MTGEVTTVAIGGTAPGTVQSLSIHRFGAPGARPKVYVQAALHADEIPGMLTAQHLIRLLQAHADAGRIMGEVVVVPLANPIGLSQRIMGGMVGRFSLADGVLLHLIHVDEFGRFLLQ